MKNFIQYFLDVISLNNHPDESLKIKTKPTYVGRWHRATNS